MKAIRIEEEGGPEVLKLVDIPAPEPGEGQAQLRVEVAGVSYADVLQRGGRYRVRIDLPAILGSRMVGTVTKVGPGGDSSMIGRRYFGMALAGTYAEYTVAKVSELMLLPEGIEPAAVLAVMSEADVGAMALRIVGHLQPGDSVFVPAATGGVGYTAVQLAQLYGAGRVLGGASTEAKRAMVAELGAIPIDYTKEGWPQEVIAQNGGKGVDLALEVNGGQFVYDTLELTRSGGRIVNFGNVSDINAPVNPRALLSRNLTLVGFSRGGTIRDGLWTEERRALNQEIADFIVAGKLRPLIAGSFRLEEVAQAHELLDSRQTIGKVILRLQD